MRDFGKEKRRSLAVASCLATVILAGGMGTTQGGEDLQSHATSLAQKYLQSVSTRCGNSYFIKEDAYYFELTGPLKAHGCHEPPEISGVGEHLRWSCGIDVGGTRVRFYSPDSGWSQWGDAPPLMVGVALKNGKWTVGDFTRSPCESIPTRREARYSRDVRVNAPNDGFLALRSHPSTQAGRRLHKIPHGTRLKLGACHSTDAKGNWCRATYAGQSGWVFDRYVDDQ